MKKLEDRPVHDPKDYGYSDKKPTLISATDDMWMTAEGQIVSGEELWGK